MDVLTLRTQIEAALASLLGTYSLGNGSTTPAMSVRSMGESMPGSTKVTGLEAILIRDPELFEASVYKEAQAIRRWTVMLIDWGGGNLQAAAGRLIYEFPGSTSRDVVLPEGVGPRSQKRVWIRTNPDGTAGSGQS